MTPPLYSERLFDFFAFATKLTSILANLGYYLYVCNGDGPHLLHMFGSDARPAKSIPDLPKRFRFPPRNYRLFAHGTQAYSEPVHFGAAVHFGAGDGDPTGQRFCHVKPNPMRFPRV